MSRQIRAKNLGTVTAGAALGDEGIRGTVFRLGAAAGMAGAAIGDSWEPEAGRLSR